MMHLDEQIIYVVETLRIRVKSIHIALIIY
jgi:hypothetical protein